MSDTKDSKKTALATRTGGAIITRPEPIVPRNFAEVMEMATFLQEAQLIPANLQKKPGNIAAVILTGRELGIPPMAAIRGLHCINDRVGMFAEMQVALIEHSGACEYWVRLVGDNTKAIYETKRVGREPQQASYTIEQAKTAGLLTKSTWRQHPAAMLRRRAQSILASDVYPDVLMGMYDPDELGDFEEEAAPVRGPQGYTAPPVPEASPVPAAPAETVIDADAAEEPAGEDWETKAEELLIAAKELEELPGPEFLDEVAALPNSPEKAAIRSILSGLATG